jgi:ABC-type antimicrobial peptide transport system permease subunit
MPVGLKLSALQETTGHEYAVRFLLGGLTTVLAGIIAVIFGPVIGGLFLAFPAIFPASVTLVEKHEREKKEKAGFRGERRGKDAAALNSAGTALGSFGLLAFGAVVWLMIPVATTWLTFLFAFATWIVVSFLLWSIRRVMR